MASSASARDGGDPADREYQAPTVNAGLPVGDARPRSWEQILQEGNREYTPEELARAKEQALRESTPVHYFADAPADPCTDPPALNSAGEEEPDVKGEYRRFLRREGNFWPASTEKGR
ncbi:hypothetical protein QLQ12_41255 [Actinoplanes sp. NEAU-A12]|uniref:Uncharacterized protein n=1 Tax=Actinoplanes sandaracinus TaxID=3045177 RepID=A0ABT6WZ62_9ACTN|nr:hypothetical protein [Actinoplanes sandaracinus]MDI6105033.1 hypothetical protein [Actinoplanes sandaracinus]